MKKVRFQIMFDDRKRKDEDYTAAQKDRFEARCAQLKNAGIKFTRWDTQRNALSKLFW